jgi:hypothetical protein
MKSMEHGLAALAAAGLVLSAGAAEAALITRTYAFSFTDFVTALGATPPPLSELSGRVTLTFDDAVSFSNQTTGITLNDYVGPVLGSALAFSSSGVPGASHGMSIGGLATGSTLVTSGNGDFVIQIRFADAGFDNPFLPTCGDGFNCGSAGPAVLPSGYSIAGQSGGWLAQTGSISLAVPEPSSWALMLMGFGGLGAALRARRRTAIVG